MTSQPLFATPSNARLFLERLSSDLICWMEEHNFLLEKRYSHRLNDFMRTSPYIHPMTSEMTAEELDRWDLFLDHIIEYNGQVDEVRLHFLDRTNLRIYQIVKNADDEYVSILRTDPIATPYFSRVPMPDMTEPRYYFQEAVYRQHWEEAPRAVLRLFTPYIINLNQRP